MAKAQADIISAVIVVLIALGLTSSALLWGLPLIQKRQDSVMVARVSNLFNQELPSKVKHVADVGGSEIFSIDASGIWVLNESANTLTFTFFSKASDKAIGMWIGGEACDSENGFNGQEGVLGFSEPCVVCVRSDQLTSGYNITYQLGCRELKSETRRYKIQLKSVTVLASNTKTIRISRGGTTQTDNLITTEIKILL